MLWFDVTKSSGQRHRSGLVRTSSCLRASLGRRPGAEVCSVIWHSRRKCFVNLATRVPASPRSDDWLLTPELFSAEERPGFSSWLDAAPCRTAAIYHDAIPLRLPEITWPASVSRHPHYMKLLARFDRVLANSAASAAELEQYWNWLGLKRRKPEAASFGADGHGIPRVTSGAERAGARLVAMLGIVEPRKNQAGVLAAAERLWAEGIAFTLRFAGRVNPHFGRPVARRIRELRQAGRPVGHEERLDDAGAVQMLAEARFTVLPSLAEGCGLPALESLWSGVPVLCSDVPALVETAAGGGCSVVRAGDTESLCAGMRELLVDDAAIARLTGEAINRALPTWDETAAAVGVLLEGD